MRQKIATLLLLAALTLGPLAGVRAQSQSELDRMAYRDFQRADARLNVVYRRVRATLDATGRAKLEKVERAWVAYRDAQADLEADVNRGGSMEPMVYSNVQESLTNDRIKALRAFQGEMQGR